MGGAADSTGKAPWPSGAQGHFRVLPKFPGNCSCQIDPTRKFRGRHPRHPSIDPDAARVWLASMIPGSYSQWSGNAADWAKNAAASLAEIILRYRLDGIDINIESNYADYPGHICALSRQLRQLMGAEVVVSVTPWSNTHSSYEQLISKCPEGITLHNYQTYSDGGFSPGASGAIPSSLTSYAAKAGWNKTTWGVSTQLGCATHSL